MVKSLNKNKSLPTCTGQWFSLLLIFDATDYINVYLSHIFLFFFFNCKHFISFLFNISFNLFVFPLLLLFQSMQTLRIIVFYSLPSCFLQQWLNIPHKEILGILDLWGFFSISTLIKTGDSCNVVCRFYLSKLVKKKVYFMYTAQKAKISRLYW